MILGGLVAPGWGPRAKNSMKKKINLAKQILTRRGPMAWRINCFLLVFMAELLAVELCFSAMFSYVSMTPLFLIVLRLFRAACFEYEMAESFYEMSELLTCCLFCT